MRYLSDVATLDLDREKCTGCDLCREVCPRDVFRREGRKIAIAGKDRCMECGACVLNCAFDALSVDKGVGCAAAVIHSLITGGEPSCGCDSEGSVDSCC